MTSARSTTLSAMGVELDLNVRTASIDERQIIMGDRTFDLFAILLARSPEIVSKNDLAEAVWPGEMVTDERLSQRISLLRKALRESGVETMEIRNDRSRGYSLIGVGDKPSTNSPESVEERHRPSRKGSGLIFAALAAGAIAFALFWSLKTDTGPPVLVDPDNGDIRISFPDHDDLREPALARIDGRNVLIETPVDEEQLALTPVALAVVCQLAGDRSHFAASPDPELIKTLDNILASGRCVAPPKR